MSSEILHCVLLSKTVDLRKHLATEIAKLDGRVNFIDHLTGNEHDVTLAVAR